MARPVRLVFLADDSQLRRALSRLVTDTTATQAALRALERTGADLHRLGRSLTMGVTLPTAAAAAGAAFLSTQFEDAMMKVHTLAGQSQAQMVAWSRQVLDLAPKVGKMPNELADGLYYIVSSGIKASDAMDVLTASAKASAVGLGETKDVADLVTSVLNAYGSENISASKSVDILLRAVKEGKGEASDFAKTIGTVIPVAAQLGVGFDQVAGSMAALSRINSNTSEVATELKNILMKILKPSDEAAKKLGSIGYSVESLQRSLREKGLLPTLLDLRDRIGSNSEAFGDLFPEIRALTGVLGMVGPNATETADVLKSVAAAGGDVDRAFSANQGTSMTKWKEALAGLAAAGIRVGDVFAPALAKVAQAVSHAADAFSKLDPRTRDTIITVLMLTAALGPLLYVMGGTLKIFTAMAKHPLITAIALLVIAFITLYQHNEKFRNAVQQGIEKLSQFGTWVKQNQTWLMALGGALGTFLVVSRGFSALQSTFGILQIVKNNFQLFALLLKGGVVKAVQAARAAWMAFNASFLASPIGIVIAIIAALAIAFVIAYKKSSTFRNFVNKAMHSVAEVSKKAWTWIVAGAKEVWVWIQNYLVPVFRLWWSAVKVYFGAIMTIMRPVINYVKTIAGLYREAFGKAADFVKKHWDVIKKVMIGIAAVMLIPLAPLILFGVVMWKWGRQIMSVLGTVLGVWWSAFKGLWTVIFTVIGAIWGFMIPIWQRIFSVASAILSVWWAAFKATMSFWWAVISSTARNVLAIWTAIWTVLGAIVKTWWAVVSTVIRVAYNVIVAIFSAVASVVGPIVSRMWNSVRSQFQAAMSVISAVMNAIWSVVRNIWNNIAGFVGPIASRIVSAVASAFSRLRSAVSGAFSGIDDIVRGSINSVIRAVNRIRIPPVTILGQTVFGGWGGPNLPMLANGAIVDKPTIAMIGEAGAELVLPLTRKQRALELLQQSGLLSDVGGRGAASGYTREASAPSGSGKSVHIENLIVQSDGRPKSIAEEVTWGLRAALI